MFSLFFVRNTVEQLMKLESEPVKVLEWIDTHMNMQLATRMKQTIQARRALKRLSS